jgi:hypothetical protein
MLASLRAEWVALGLSGVGVVVNYRLPVEAQRHGFYSREALAASKAEARVIWGFWPVWVKREFAQQIRLHDHAYVPVEACQTLPDSAHVSAIYDLEGKIRYLSKPGPASVCRSKHRRNVPETDLWAASEELLTARKLNGKRLPNQSFALNLPRKKRFTPPELSFEAALACAAGLLILSCYALDDLLGAQHQARRERLTRLAQRQAARASAPSSRLAPQRRAASLPSVSGQISAASALNGLYRAKPEQISRGPP